MHTRQPHPECGRKRGKLAAGRRQQSRPSLCCPRPASACAAAHRQARALPRRLRLDFLAGPCFAAAGCLLLLEVGHAAGAARGQVAVEMDPAHLQRGTAAVWLRSCSLSSSEGSLVWRSSRSVSDFNLAAATIWLALHGSSRWWQRACAAKCNPCPACHCRIAGAATRTHHVLHSRVARRKSDVVRLHLSSSGRAIAGCRRVRARGRGLATAAGARVAPAGARQPRRH